MLIIMTIFDLADASSVAGAFTHWCEKKAKPDKIAVLSCISKLLTVFQIQNSFSGELVNFRIRDLCFGSIVSFVWLPCK